MNNNLTIIVNSSDNFEDCWSPFFKLLFNYWPNCYCHIILNTEKKRYVNDNFNITVSLANLGIHYTLTWSECLIAAIKQVRTPFLLYLQEDYFVDGPVNYQEIEEFLQMMLNDDEIKYIGLTTFGNRPPFLNYSADSRLKIVSKRSKYRISTQAGIWRKEILLSYLEPKENGWMFEIFGTKRAQKRDELFLTVNADIYGVSKKPIISYIHTGIIKGRWHKDIPSLFKRHDIGIDFSERGMYKEKPELLRKFETMRKLLKNPVQLLKGLLGK